jgi:hypothetical protein
VLSCVDVFLVFSVPAERREALLGALMAQARLDTSLKLFSGEATCVALHSPQRGRAWSDASSGLLPRPDELLLLLLCTVPLVFSW